MQETTFTVELGRISIFESGSLASPPQNLELRNHGNEVIFLRLEVRTKGAI